MCDNATQLFAAVIPPDDLCNIHLPAALYGQYFTPEFSKPTIIRDRTYVARLQCGRGMCDAWRQLRDLEAVCT